MCPIDIFVVIGYLLLIMVIAIVFKKFSFNSSHFVSGSSAMPWWMVGATCFMTQFSTWTFTGAAGKAFDDGFSILIIFFGNAIGFLVAGIWFAKRYRLLRVETAMEIIRLRFGRQNEKIFTVLQFVLSMLSGAIWLNGLAIFFSAAFNIDLKVTIILVGLLVTILALSGGAWSVSALNVVQLILLLAITFIVGVYAFYLSGGPLQLVRSTPYPFFLGQHASHFSLYVTWLVIACGQQLISTNNMMSSFRFLGTRSEYEAKYAAFLAAGLFIIWPVLWFAPAWFSAIKVHSLLAYYPKLGKDASNSAYLYFVQYYLPHGVLGLTMSAMLAATFSPMATMLNRNTGFFIRSVYMPWRKQINDEKHLLKMSRITTMLIGIVTIVAAIIFSLQSQVSFFYLLMMLGAFLNLPLTIPCLLAIIIVKTPDWSGWATLLVGLAVSLVIHFCVDIKAIISLFTNTSLTKQEFSDVTLIITVLCQIVFTGGFFCLSRYFYPKNTTSIRKNEITLFNKRINQPLAANEIKTLDSRIPNYLIYLTAIIGILIISLAFLSNYKQGAIFCYIGAFCLFIALLLKIGVTLTRNHAAIK